MGDCVLRLSFKTVGVTLGALMRLIPREKVVALGAMWRRCLLMVTSKSIHGMVIALFIASYSAHKVWEHLGSFAHLL